MATVSLVAEDPELAADLDEPLRRRAEQLIVAPVRRLERGPWDPGEGPPGPEHAGHLGLLVLDGLLLRGLDLHGAACVELIGGGDVVRPWEHREAFTLARESRWEVIQPVRAAVLERRVTAAIGQFPPIVARLVDRLIVRSHSLAFHLAVCGLPRIELRLLAVLWNLAERWGRVRPDGVALPLPLTQRALAQLVAARRPSVTTALGTLRRRGLVEPLRGGGWLLHGDPPEELQQIRDQLGRRTTADELDPAPPAAD